MIALLAFWSAWRLTRVLAPILVIAAFALLLLSGTHRTTNRPANIAGRLQHAARPLERELQHAPQKALKP